MSRTNHKICRRLCLALTFLLLCPILYAQTAELSGLISDPSGLPVPRATADLKNRDTGTMRRVVSNQQGLYSVVALAPGSYDLSIEALGFKSIHQNGIVLEVDQRASLDFTLTIGSRSESVTVSETTPLINATDASVSTVIRHQFVENMPLNGRSFSSLIELAPGVVLTPANLYEQGQFSVNGQRPDANYFMVDGVSANFGNAGGGGLMSQGGSGQLPATNAFGGVSNLVSLDALEEFRIQTSTFAPEYGRTPGAQISVVTKSGTNAFHGTAFEYFRHDKLDANDWFANANRVAKPALRQNDFGGVLGGPIKKDKLFFFGSYEGMRVRQPHVANTYVPNLASRQNAPSAVQPLLNAFPLPTGKDFGNGTAAFAAGYSDPSSLNSYGIRVDYLISPNVTVFGRYSNAPSKIDVRGGTTSVQYADVQNLKYDTQAATIGSNQSITARMMNEIRFNYSRVTGSSRYTLDSFGGATPPPDSVLYPSFTNPPDSFFQFNADTTPYGLKYNAGKLGNNWEQQVNVTDSLSQVIGTHRLKFGLDYRRLGTKNGFYAYDLQSAFSNLANVLANNMPRAVVIARNDDVELAFTNVSLFAQDTWKVTRLLTVTYGLRWEYNTAPSSPSGTLPFTVDQVNNFATMTVAPQGAALWDPPKNNFAPRLGVAWQASSNLVLRAGGGIFYDLGYSSVMNAAGTWPYSRSKNVLNTPFPVSSANAAPPPFSTTLPASYMAVVDPNHFLPRTYEWNASAERSVGNSDVVTLSYIGAAARKLMRYDIYVAPNPNFSGEFDVMRNGSSSSYNALQAQHRHRFSHGLQALLSYTWSHSIDDVSTDGNWVSVPPGASALSNRGSSDYDIRQTFSGAISYNIPAPASGIWKAVFGNWSTDSIIYARTAPPVNVVTGQATPGTALSAATSVQRPNLVPNVQVWISDPNVAGGKKINKAAFSVPTATVQGNLGRNALNGFGATEVDLTLRRQFKLYERLSLQARADFFNLFNHPNFGPPTSYMTSPLFGQANQMLGASLGAGGQTGGLNPLYQIGGPRSAQLALKLMF